MALLKKIALTFFALGLVFSFAPSYVYGQNLAEEIGQQANAFAGESGAGIAENNRDPRVVVARLINVFLGFIGTLFVSFTIYAGYLIMTAAGEEEKVNKGKMTLRNAVIGVLVTISAFAITNFVTRTYLASSEYSGTHGFGGGVNFGTGARPEDRVRGPGSVNDVNLPNLRFGD